MISVQVDDRKLEVLEGTTALTALRSIGLDVPTGCHDDRLQPTGGCRLCLIRLKGTNRPVTACALVLKDGMEIEVDAPDLVDARKDELALLARNYPEGAIGLAPEKSFNQWLVAYGLTGLGGLSDAPYALVGESNLKARSSSRTPKDESNPYFRFNPESCIKCFSCVRVCEEVQGANVWQIMDRPSQTHVIPDSMGRLSTALA